MSGAYYHVGLGDVGQSCTGGYESGWEAWELCHFSDPVAVKRGCQTPAGRNHSCDANKLSA
jgi:hypothetical protein